MINKTRDVEVCCELSAMLRPKTYPFGVKFCERLGKKGLLEQYAHVIL